MIQKIMWLLLLASFSVLGAQEHFDWVLDQGDKNFYEIQTLSNNYLENLRTEEPGQKTKSTGTKIPGYKQFKRWEWFMEDRVYPKGNLYNTIAKTWYEYHMYLQSNARSRGNFAGEWKSIGPSSYDLGFSGYNGGLGRVNCVAFDPENKDILYVGTPSSGLWQRNGSDWKCLTDELPVVGISGISVTNTGTVFVLTGDGDGGNTNSIGVLKSTDRGNSWVDTGLIWGVKQSVRGYKLAMHPDQNTIIVVTNTGLFQSEDRGSNWEQVANGNFRDLEYQPGASTVAYAATTNKIYRSEDTGKTWQEVNANFPTSSNRIALAVSPANPKTVYALFASGSGYLGVYKSSDAGKTFSLRSSSPNLMGYSPTGNDTSSQSWYDLALVASPENDDIVHLGGVNTWRSNDGGKTWKITSYWIESDQSHGYTHADIHALEYNGNDLYCGSDGGIYHSPDRGETWSSLSKGLQIMQIYKIADTPQDPYLLYAGAQDNGSNRITGSNGTHVFGADGGTCAIDYSDVRKVYIATQSGGMYKSTDAGSSFSSVKPSSAGSGAWVTPYVMHPENTQTIFAGYTDVWKTTNGTNSWQNISKGKIDSGTARSIAVSKKNPDYIYVTKTNAIYFTNNGGNTWANITNNLPISSVPITSVDINENDPKHIAVTFSGYDGENKVYHSTDAGSTWKNISETLPNLPVHIIAFENDAHNGMYVGTDAGVYYHNDELKKWVSFSNQLPNTIIKDIKIHAQARKIRVGTFGRGLWESTLYIDAPVKRNEDKETSMTSYHGDIQKFK